MSIIETVLRFADITSVIPVLPRSKIAAVPWREYQNQQPTLDKLANWFIPERFNVGILTGSLVVIDFDNLVAFDVWRAFSISGSPKARDIAQYGYKVLTSRGVHVYVKCVEHVRTSKIIGGDIKAYTGYVLGAGSIHPSGIHYRAIDDDAPIFSVVQLSEILPDFFLSEQLTGQLTKTPPPPQPTLPDDPLACLDAPRPPVITEHVKSRTRVEDLLDMRRAQQTGPYKFLINCPFHDDEHPSFWVDTQLQLCGCFSGCTRKPLDVINLYARLYNLSNRDALFALSRTSA